MKYKAIIFDLDGVICHTDKYHYQAWKTIAGRLGIPFDEKVNERLRGVSRMESLDIILEKSGKLYREEDKKKLAEEKNESYKGLLQSMTACDLSEEVRETLFALRKKGLLLAIGSSSKNAGFILERIGLGNFFDAVSDGNNIIRSKPDPEVFLKGARYLELPPEDCLVAEDAAAGIEAARAAGMDSVLLGGTGQKASPTYRARHFSELLTIVGD